MHTQKRKESEPNTKQSLNHKRTKEERNQKGTTEKATYPKRTQWLKSTYINKCSNQKTQNTEWLKNKTHTHIYELPTRDFQSKDNHREK